MLDDDAIARYARQIIVPGIGAAGQERLMAATVLVLGSTRGMEQARLYLEAAGATTVDDAARDADLAIVAGVADAPPDLLRALAAATRPVCWYALHDEGFTAGVHPAAPLPLHLQADSSPDATSDPRHDAAACDAAAVACAILIGLGHRQGPVHFDGGAKAEDG